MSDTLSMPRHGFLRHGLTGTTLKLMALVLMLLDHIHYFFEFTGAIPLWFSTAGRLSAPLFLFCTVEGFAHTHDRRRYFRRIWAISAGMGLLLFLMMYAGFPVRPDGFFPLNAIFMNFVILIPIWQGIDWVSEKRIGRGLTAIALPLIWPFLFLLLYAAANATPAAWLLDSVLAALAYTVLPAWNLITDGGGFYIMIGIALYLLRGRRNLQVGAFVVLTTVFHFVFPYVQLISTPDFHLSMMFTVAYEWLGVFAAIPMLLYNGHRGAGLKKLFYIFYPTHVYLLYALSWGVMILMD